MTGSAQINNFNVPNFNVYKNIVNNYRNSHPNGSQFVSQYNLGFGQDLCSHAKGCVFPNNPSILNVDIDDILRFNEKAGWGLDYGLTSNLSHETGHVWSLVNGIDFNTPFRTDFYNMVNQMGYDGAVEFMNKHLLGNDSHSAAEMCAITFAESEGYYGGYGFRVGEASEQFPNVAQTCQSPDAGSQNSVSSNNLQIKDQTQGECNGTVGFKQEGGSVVKTCTPFNDIDLLPDTSNTLTISDLDPNNIANQDLSLDYSLTGSSNSTTSLNLSLGDLDTPTFDYTFKPSELTNSGTTFSLTTDFSTGSSSSNIGLDLDYSFKPSEFSLAASSENTWGFNDK